MIDFKMKGKKLITYIMAGYVSLKFTNKIVLALQDAGVAAIEIGIPYSDPVIEGPVIANSSIESLENGTNLDKIFNSIDKIKDKVKIPLYMMSYYSPLYSYGHKKLINKAKKTGITGFILPDLTIEEGDKLINELKENNLDPILLAFPNTDNERLKIIEKYSGSFIYYVNLFGTTGVREGIVESSYERLAEIKKLIKKPICAGFGVGNKEQFDKLSVYSDGVIIGSKIIKLIMENKADEDKAIEKVSEFVGSLLK